MKKHITLVILAFIVIAISATNSYASSNKGSVYYYNFKPESDSAWQELAKVYTQETGIPVRVETVAQGKYWPTLREKLKTKDKPSLFQVTDLRMLEDLRNHCLDLESTKLYKELNNEAYSLRDKYGKVRGIAYAVESYGIIVNRHLLEEAGYDIDDITSFLDLKNVAEDITARKSELEFSAFCSSGMNPSSDWRFKTHMANMPIYFENKSQNRVSLEKFQGTFLNNLKDLWDLYINNSTCSPKEIATKGIEEARQEFIDGKAVFYQNGSWEYVNLVNSGMSKYQLAMIPIYFGVGEEDKQGLCTGTENYWCINKNASPRDIKATMDFLHWCVTSEKGTRALAQKMGFSIPFMAAAYSENIFIQQNAINNAKGKTPISWDFTTIPTENWKKQLSQKLTNYAINPTNQNWNQVVTSFVNGWNK